MAWITPPTFTAAAVLTAAQLNIISDDLAWLNGIAQSANAPFSSLRITGGALTVNNNLWMVRHRLQYLYYQLFGSATAYAWTAYYNGTSIANGTINVGSATQTVTGSVDLDATLGTPTVGTWYPVHMSVSPYGPEAPSEIFSINYLYESDS